MPTLAQTAMSLSEPNTQSIHHQIQSNLDLHGLLKLPKLSDDNLNDSNHPFSKLRAAHTTDSGFFIATRRLDKFATRFRMSVNEFMLLYDKLLSYLNRAMSSSEGQGRVAGRALTSAEMLLIWLWRADDVNIECLCIIFNDVDRSTIDRYADHTTKAILQCLGDRLYWPDVERATSKEEYQDMVKWNEEFDFNRTRVEAAIGKLKRRAQSLSKKYPRDGARQAELLTATACLLNYLRDFRTQQALIVNQLVD